MFINFIKSIQAKQFLTILRSYLLSFNFFFLCNSCFPSLGHIAIGLFGKCHDFISVFDRHAIFILL